MKCIIKVKFVNQNEMLCFEDETNNIEELTKDLKGVFNCDKISIIETPFKTIMLRPTRIDCIIIDHPNSSPKLLTKEKSKSTSKRIEQNIKNNEVGTITVK